MSQTVNVTLGGENISVVIDGGNMGAGASVGLQELNQAVGEAKQAADDAEASANQAAQAVAGVPAIATAAGTAAGAAAGTASGAVAGEAAALTVVATRLLKVETLSDLRAVVDTEAAVFVRGRSSDGDGYAGTFEWVSGDQSANVAADPQSGIWVAPSGQDGSAGAWKRAFTGAVDVAWFGASPNNSSADNEAAFLAAEAYAASIARPIHVGIGTWQLVNPLNHGLNVFYVGEGTLRFDYADHLRRGGSAGLVEPYERYTLMYDFDDAGDVSILVDGVATAILGWEGPRTVQVTGATTASQIVTVRVANGSLRLSASPQSLRARNMLSSGAQNLTFTAIDTPPISISGGDNTSYGARALMGVTTGGNNTAYGSSALASVMTGGNNTGMGFQALYRFTGHANTAFGSVAGEWQVTGDFNSYFGAAAGAKNISGEGNTAIGNNALAANRLGSFNTAVGHRSGANPPYGNYPTSNTAVGAFSGEFYSGDNNVSLGYRAGCGPNAGSDGTDNVFIGFFAGRNQEGADYNVGIGSAAHNALTSGQSNVAIGRDAGKALTTNSHTVLIGDSAGLLNTVADSVAVGSGALGANVTGTRNTAIGRGSLGKATSGSNTGVGFYALGEATSGSDNTAVGSFAAQNVTTGTANSCLGVSAGASTTTGSFNTNIGRQAGQFLTTGNNNTNVGVGAGRLDQSGGNATTFANAACIGANSAVSGDNQVQLGNSATTTYVYGTVQNRSDERDKADIRDTQLGLDFILALRPVDYRWDMREDYIEVEEVEVEREYTELEAEDDGAGGINYRPVTRIVVEKDTVVVKHDKDGSKKRTRFHHGFVAQEVQQLINDGVIEDFGGLQDHSVNGGCDVQSIGYDEIIAPLVKAVQQLAARVAQLEGRA